MTFIPQFGEPVGEYLVRPGVYGVVFDDQDQVLVVKVRGRYHLPGGGIDPNENLEEALAREVREETGYTATGFTHLGQANQFLPETSLGPMNKLGTFFLATIDRTQAPVESEADHEVHWVPINEYLASTANEYQKWAVERALGRDPV